MDGRHGGRRRMRRRARHDSDPSAGGGEGSVQPSRGSESPPLPSASPRVVLLRAPRETSTSGVNSAPNLLPVNSRALSPHQQQQKQPTVITIATTTTSLNSVQSLPSTAGTTAGATLSSGHRKQSPSPSPSLTLFSRPSSSTSGLNNNAPHGGPQGSSSSSSPSPSTPHHIMQSNSHGGGGGAPVPVSVTLSDQMGDIIANCPQVMNLIDGDSWSFNEQLSDNLFGDNVCAGLGGFTVIGVCGMQSVGKSSLMNKLAGKDVFKTHAMTFNDNLLRHVTHGIDLHISPERLFLLDSQPLVSASLLDEHIKTVSQQSLGTNIATDINSEPETYIYITSLQIVSFLLSMCDYLIVVNDWTIDVHLVKLLATSIMMVNNSLRAKIVWFCPKMSNIEFKKVSSTLEAILGAGGGGCHVQVINGNEDQLVSSVMKSVGTSSSPSRRGIGIPSDLNGGHHHEHPHSHQRRNQNNSTHFSTPSTPSSSEKSWLIAAQRYWDTSVRKSTLYSDYARFMP